MSDLGEQAIARAAFQSANGPPFGLGECLLRTRLLFDAPSIGDFDGDGSADAEDGWKAAEFKHPFDGDYNGVPRGVPFWWSGGSDDNGHVAPTIGSAACWSTDIKRIGFYDLVPLARIHDQWGLTPLGWTEDINGVRVFDNQEDDMIPEDLLNFKIPAAGNQSVRSLLVTEFNRGARIEAALTALAAGLSPAVEAAVRDALAEGVVDVSVSVHDKTGA